MAEILVVDDKASMRTMLDRLLSPGHSVDLAADGRDAIDHLEAKDYDLLLTDVRLPDIDGFAVLEACRRLRPDTPVIMMTAYARVEAAVQAVKTGAYDYVAKPFEPDELILTLDRALERRRLVERARAAEENLRRREDVGDMLGHSPAIEAVRRLIDRVAALDVTVLITGESGTGKEVAARALHKSSRVADGPFVAVNCGAIPEALLESELFGHVRGAFTGATSAREGLFAEARDGTIFLDEIGDLPLELQVKLNRALQERTYRRVGESSERPVKARIIAATHKDLEASVAAGRFRDDLFFRLNVYPIALPPLRERGEDVLLLAGHFLEQAAQRHGRPARRFDPDALRALADYGWPGNIRELAHVVERAVILCESERIEVADLPPNMTAGSARGEGAASTVFAHMDYRSAMEWTRERATRQYLTLLMQRHKGNVTQAAQHAAIERESLHRLLRKAGVDAASFRSSA